MLHKREILAKMYGGGFNSEVQFSCPNCGEEDEYYMFPPCVCNNCGFHIEALLLLEPKEDLEAQVTFYRDGEL